jgi:hypothetical protein
MRTWLFWRGNTYMCKHPFDDFAIDPPQHYFWMKCFSNKKIFERKVDWTKKWWAAKILNKKNVSNFLKHFFILFSFSLCSNLRIKKSTWEHGGSNSNLVVKRRKANAMKVGRAQHTLLVGGATFAPAPKGWVGLTWFLAEIGRVYRSL